MAMFACGWIVGFVLLFLTSFFARVPMNILGSIIIVSVASLVEYEQAIYLWKASTMLYKSTQARYARRPGMQRSVEMSSSGGVEDE